MSSTEKSLTPTDNKELKENKEKKDFFNSIEEWKALCKTIRERDSDSFLKLFAQCSFLAKKENRPFLVDIWWLIFDVSKRTPDKNASPENKLLHYKKSKNLAIIARSLHVLVPFKEIEKELSFFLLDLPMIEVGDSLHAPELLQVLFECEATPRYLAPSYSSKEFPSHNIIIPVEIPSKGDPKERAAQDLKDMKERIDSRSSIDTLGHFFELGFKLERIAPSRPDCQENKKEFICLIKKYTHFLSKPENHFMLYALWRAVLKVPDLEVYQIMSKIIPLKQIEKELDFFLGSQILVFAANKNKFGSNNPTYCFTREHLLFFESQGITTAQKEYATDAIKKVEADVNKNTKSVQAYLQRRAKWENELEHLKTEMFNEIMKRFKARIDPEFNNSSHQAPKPALKPD